MLRVVGVEVCQLAKLEQRSQQLHAAAWEHCETLNNSYDPHIPISRYYKGKSMRPMIYADN